MRLRVIKQFDWDGWRYERGDVIEIPDGHPRLEAMVTQKFVIDDGSNPSDDDHWGTPLSEIGPEQEVRPSGLPSMDEHGEEPIMPEALPELVGTGPRSGSRRRK